MPGAELLGLNFFRYLIFHHIVMGCLLFIHPKNQMGYWLGIFFVVIGLSIFILLLNKRKFFTPIEPLDTLPKNGLRGFDILFIFGFWFFLSMLKAQIETVVGSVWGATLNIPDWILSVFILVGVAIYVFWIRRIGFGNLKKQKK